MISPGLQLNLINGHGIIGIARGDGHSQINEIAVVEEVAAAAAGTAAEIILLGQLGDDPVVGAVHVHLDQLKLILKRDTVKMAVVISEGHLQKRIAVCAGVAAVGLIAQDVEFVAAGLGKVDQSVSRWVHVVVAFLRLHEKSVSVLIPVFPWLDFKVCGGGGGGFCGAGGEGEGEGQKH